MQEEYEEEMERVVRFYLLTLLTSFSVYLSLRQDRKTLLDIIMISSCSLVTSSSSFILDTHGYEFILLLPKPYLFHHGVFE